MTTSTLTTTIDIFRDGRDLGSPDAEALLDAIISESDEALLAELFQAWDAKGIAEDEIYSIARIMRGRCTRVNSRHARLIDIVGTGGSRSKTFNVSTAAAFVAAGAGAAVAKHGNRAATSSSGSADVLSALGIEPAVDAATAERCLNEIGICFMFAPNFHRLSPTLGKVRRGLGFPTIFNCVGPLCNPASAPHQLIGVWSAELVPRMAGALAKLGTGRSWVVHGNDGIDEISLSGESIVAEVADGKVEMFEISPSDFGISPQTSETLRTDSAETSAAIIRDVLASESDETPARALVKINAAAALFVAGYGENVFEAFEFANDSVRGGHARRKLEGFVAFQQT